MAERMMYEPTESNLKKWNRFEAERVAAGRDQMPTDEQFKEVWAKAHRGKTAGWGLGKRDWIINNMQCSRDYQYGLWQGRVDAARGLEYSEERIDSAYNLGYYRGYTEFESNWKGWDAATRESFASKYMTMEVAA